MGEVDSIVNMIEGGHVDDDLREIIDTVQLRYREIGKEMFDSLDIGDSVAIRPDAMIKTKYMIGATGEVVNKRQRKVVVRLDDGIHDPYHKWAGKDAVMPPEWLKHIDPQDRQ